MSRRYVFCQNSQKQSIISAFSWIWTNWNLTSAESKATYEEIQEWVQEKYGFHVTHLNIAKTKRKYGIIERKNYNLPKSEDSRFPETPQEKEDAIIDAFKHFQVI